MSKEIIKEAASIEEAKALIATELGVNMPPVKDYVLNTNTMKFHKTSCSSVKDIAEWNRKDFTGTREDVIAMGYQPCGKCHP